jgi:hypothetical protein
MERKKIEHIVGTASETKRCYVCEQIYRTGNVITGKDVLDGVPYLNGQGICPEHQRYIDEGYTFIIGVKRALMEDISGFKGLFWPIHPEIGRRTAFVHALPVEELAGIKDAKDGNNEGINQEIVLMEQGDLDRLRQELDKMIEKGVIVQRVNFFGDLAKGEQN